MLIAISVSVFIMLIAVVFEPDRKITKNPGNILGRPISFY